MPRTDSCKCCQTADHEYTLVEFPGAVVHEVCRPCAERLCAPASNVWISCTSPSYEPLAAQAA